MELVQGVRYMLLMDQLNLQQIIYKGLSSPAGVHKLTTSPPKVAGTNVKNDAIYGV